MNVSLLSLSEAGGLSGDGGDGSDRSGGSDIGGGRGMGGGGGGDGVASFLSAVQGRSDASGGGSAAEEARDDDDVVTGLIDSALDAAKPSIQLAALRRPDFWLRVVLIPTLRGVLGPMVLEKAFFSLAVRIYGRLVEGAGRAWS